MSMSDLKRALELIEISGDGDFVGPQPENRIARAEQVLNIVFPPTYREFLRRLGCGEIFGDEFYGLVNDDFENSGVPDAVWSTLSLRRSVQLSKSFIVVGSTGDGGDYVIDVSQKNSESESPVVEWWFGNPPCQRVVAEDFGAFVWQCLQSG